MQFDPASPQFRCEFSALSASAVHSPEPVERTAFPVFSRSLRDVPKFSCAKLEEEIVFRYSEGWSLAGRKMPLRGHPVWDVMPSRGLSGCSQNLNLSAETDTMVKSLLACGDYAYGECYG